MSAITITRENLYDYFVINEWDEDEKNDGTDGFNYEQNYDLDTTEEIGEVLHDKMFEEIRLNYDDFNNERSCMWVEEVKRRAKWVRGETLYGYSREKHYTYHIWWSRDKKHIGHPIWILEADGYVSFSFQNGYTNNETENTKYCNYIRPSCLYNNKNCNELDELKKQPKPVVKKNLIIESDSEEEVEEKKVKSCDVCGEKIPSPDACKACEFIIDDEHIAPTPVPEPVKTIKIKVKKVKKVLIIVEDNDEVAPEPVVVVDEVISYNDDLIKKLETAGIDNLISIYGGQFKRRISNMKASSIPLEKRRNLIITKIMEAVVKSDDKNHAKKIIDLWFAEKPKQEKPAEWINKFVVGEDVLYIGNHTPYIKCKIQKINKKSISINFYNYNKIEDEFAIENHTYGKDKLVWTTLQGKSHTILSRGKVVKKGEDTWYDKQLKEGEWSCDYGR